MKFFFISALLLVPCAAPPATIMDEKAVDLKKLEGALFEAKRSIAASQTVQAADFLLLLPTVSVSRRATTDALTESSNETFIGVSVSSSQLWNISERASSRKAARERSFRTVESLGFRIRTLIERKFLLKERLWKMRKIRASLDNPVEIASYDEKIDDETIALQECEIAIEKGFAEIEFAVVEAGR